MPIKFKIINKKDKDTASSPTKLISIHKKMQNITGRPSPRKVREIDYSLQNPVGKNDFILEINKKDEAVVLPLIKKYKHHLKPYWDSSHKKEIKKFRIQLNARGFDIIEQAAFTKEKTSNADVTLMEIPKLDFTQAINLSNEEATAMPKQNHVENEEPKTTSPTEPRQEKNEIESLTHYTETLVQCLLQKKAIYATYHCVFDAENKFFEQIKLIRDELTSGGNISNLNHALLNLDFNITQHEILLIKGLITFLQTKLHVEAINDTKYIDLHKVIDNIKVIFNSFDDKAIDKALIAQHKKCAEDIALLHEKIKPVFASLEEIKAEIMKSITDIETLIDTEYNALDEAVKTKINKDSFLDILSNIRTKDLDSPEVSFTTIFYQLNDLLNQFTEKKNEASQHLIPACSVVPDSAIPSTVDTLPVNTDSLKSAFANFEAKNQAISYKHQNLMRGFTSLFFRDISQQKQTALGEILQTQMTVKEITHSLLADNTGTSSQEDQIKALKSALNKLHASINKNMSTLEQYRGLFSGKTTSDQLVHALKTEACHLEETLDSFTSPTAAK